MRPVVRGGAVISGAVGAWIALGAVALAPGPTAASRVAVLPPFWILALLIALLGVVVFALRLPDARVRPLYAALLALAPLLPFDVPAALLLWQGVPAAMLFAGIGVAMVAAEPIAWPNTLRRWATEPRLAPCLAAVAAVIVFGLAWRGTAKWLPAGDEPHYLVIAQSLLHDRDLRIDDNHERREYLAYFNGELKPDFLKRGRDGHIYSVHAPGVSALVAPAFALSGYRGAAVFLLVVCASGTGLLWLLAHRTTGSAQAAWFGWAASTLAVPIVAHGYTIYPDGLSSVLLLCAVAGLVNAPAASARALLGVGLAAALLPWLHTRNAVIAGVVGGAMVLRLLGRKDRWRAIASYAAIPVLGAGAWFVSFQLIYGTFSPAAPYGGYANSRPEYLLPGVPGLFFDQQYGFLATAPAFLVALVGLALALSGRASTAAAERESTAGNPRLAVELVLTFTAYLLAVASYRMWWGGASAPARFLVPVLMPLGIPAAWAWQSLSRPGDRAAMGALLVLSAALTAAFTWGGDGMVAFTTRATYGPLYEWMTRAVDLASGLPSSFRSAPGVVVQTALPWLGAAMVAWIGLRSATHSRAGAAAAAPWVTAVAIMVALSGVWATGQASPLRVDSSRLAALLRIEPRAHALLIGHAARSSDLDGAIAAAPRALPLLRIHQVARGPVPKGQLASAAPLRAGVYRIALSAGMTPEASVGVGIGRSGPVITKKVSDVPTGAGGRREFTVELPVEVNALTVTSATPAEGEAAWIEPVSLQPGAGEFAGGRAATAQRYGDLIAYFVTDRQFPEPNGLWIRPNGESFVIVQPDRPRSTLELVLRNGPFENAVDVRTDAGTERIALAPGETRVLQVPVAAGARAASVAFRVSRWFRPSEVDPKSDDVRRLGAWLEFTPPSQP